MLGSWWWEERRRIVYRVLSIAYKSKNTYTIPYTVYAILLFSLINIYFSASRPVAAYHWMKVLEFALLGVYIMRTKPDVFLITRLLSVAVLYSSVLAIWQFILQHSVGGIFWWLGERVFTTVSPGIAQTPLCFPMFRGCPLVLRSYATFPHPNVLGGFLAVTLPLIINLQISKSTNLRMNETIFIFFKWIAIGLGITALVLTFSRSAWIVGFLGMFMVHRSWFMEKRKNKTVSFMTAIVFILLAFAVIFYSLFVIHNSYEESVVVRLALNESALSMWKQYSLLGVGLGNFLVVLPSVLPSRIIYFLQPVHNIYLLLLSEIGVIGICLFLLLGVYFVKHELRIMNYGKTKERHVLFVDHYPLSLQQGRLFFTLLISLNLVPQFRYK